MFMIQCFDRISLFKKAMDRYGREFFNNESIGAAHCYAIWKVLKSLYGNSMSVLHNPYDNPFLKRKFSWQLFHRVVVFLARLQILKQVNGL